MTSQPIVHELLGLSGHPDPIKAAIAKVHLPCGVEPDDIAQHCRLRVAMAAPRYEAEKGKPFSFAYGIARKEALSFLRGHGRRVKRLEPLPLQLGSVPDHDATQQREVVLARIRHAVSLLPEDLQTVIRLVSLEERPRRLVSQSLGLSMQELNEQVILARGFLKRILTDQPLTAEPEDETHALRPEAAA